eukprot:TRINITY_DN17048_c0_g1_i1.p1 TRINITY_DN17048_c0_g1~~TRINITY_DN17048_c0_g1_i1.p1  ORF type:complete len:155 (-),score=23.33 TRINITY_DN17048_c0_g1_i1:239-703(-)
MLAAPPVGMEGRPVQRKGKREQIGSDRGLIYKEEAEGAASMYGCDSQQNIYKEYDQKRRSVRAKAEALEAAWARQKELEGRLNEKKEPTDYVNGPEDLQRAFKETEAAFDELGKAMQEAEECRRQLGAKAWLLETAEGLGLRGTGLSLLTLLST